MFLLSSLKPPDQAIRTHRKEPRGIHLWTAGASTKDYILMGWLAAALMSWGY